MGLSLRERFENYMDSSSPDTIGDAEKFDIALEDVYDDLFEERLANTSEYTGQESPIDTNKEQKLPDRKENEEHIEKMFSSNKNNSAEAHLGKDKEIDDSDILSVKGVKELFKGIVFEGKTKENPQYGEGGGKQYFIPDFGDMKLDGRMTKLNEVRLEYKGPFIEDTGTTAAVEKQNHQFDYCVDITPLTDDEKAEWTQLDEETRDEQGLSKVMLDKESQIVVDRKNPWSDQEDSQGSVFPDAYSDPRELKSGEIYYQLRPTDARFDSPYVTDEKTVESCRDENGEVDAVKLLQKLQIRPLGGIEYSLTQYMYRPEYERNSSGN